MPILYQDGLKPQIPRCTARTINAVLSFHACDYDSFNVLRVELIGKMGTGERIRPGFLENDFCAVKSQPLYQLGKRATRLNWTPGGTYMPCKENRRAGLLSLMDKVIQCEK
jgi:hypothetical protein